MNKFADIINLSRPISKKHKPMSMESRAAQFAAFAALSGYDEVIDETGKINDERYADKQIQDNDFIAD